MRGWLLPKAIARMMPPLTQAVNRFSQSPWVGFQTRGVFFIDAVKSLQNSPHSSMPSSISLRS